MSIRIYGMAVIAFLAANHMSGQVAEPASPTNLDHRAIEVSKWRHVAKPALLEGNDTVDARTRAIRDRFFDSIIGANAPLGTDAARGAGFVEDVGPNPGPEIEPSDVIALVTFEDYQPYLSGSKRSLYTEVKLKVERLLRADAQSQNATSLTLILPGGTIGTPSGPVSYGNSLDDPFQLQPQHRYVVFLRHEMPGNFYSLANSWELIGGSVYPNSGDSMQRQVVGSSHYSGMPEAEFLAVVTTLLSAK